jgi:hypothetical protein
MSHQVKCYLDPVDTDALEALLRDGEDLRILHSRSTSPAPRVVPSVTVEENGTLWLLLYFVRAADLDQVVMRREPDAQGEAWTVDALRSPVIELERSFYDASVLRRGRLYFVDGFRGEGENWVEKPQAFKEWANAALKKAKKMMLRHTGEYIGPHAQSWLEQWHGQLVI